MIHHVLTLLLPVIISLVIIISTSILHYKKHFKIHTLSLTSPKTPINRRTTIFSKTQSLQIKKKSYECCCWIGPIDDQDYDFFPSSFCFYAIFTMFLCTILITKSILTDHTTSTYIQTIDSVYYYILIYGVMIVSVWESLFSFCRYWITKIAEDQCRVASTTYCLKRFILYIIAYFTLWTLYTYVIHNIFVAIIIVTCHCTFNIYCISMNASILIKQYGSISPTDSSRNLPLFNLNKEIVNAVYFMKHASIISNIISTIYLSIFLIIITYNHYTNVTYYLSILWAISCFIFSLNFHKNRSYIRYKILQLLQFIRGKDNNNKHQISETLNKKISVQINVDPSEITVNEINYKELMVNTPGITPGIDNIQNNVYANIIQIGTVNNCQTNPTNLNNKLETKTTKNGATLYPTWKESGMLGLSHSVSCDAANAYKFTNKSISTNTTIKSNNSSHSVTNSKSLKQSIIESTNTLTLKLGFTTKSESNYINMDKEESNSEKEKDDITCVYNEIITPQPTEQSEHLQYPNAITETPQISLELAPPMIAMTKSVSVPSVKEKQIHLKLPQKTQLNHNNVKSMNININNMKANISNVGLQTRHIQQTKKSFYTHSRGNHSMNFANNTNLDQIFLSLNTLASHGFCSRNSINSAQQIKLHQIKVSQQFELSKLEEMNQNNKFHSMNESMPKLSLTTSTM
eukprot:478043_1